MDHDDQIYAKSFYQGGVLTTANKEDMDLLGGKGWKYDKDESFRTMEVSQASILVDQEFKDQQLSIHLKQGDSALDAVKTNVDGSINVNEVEWDLVSKMAKGGPAKIVFSDALGNFDDHIVRVPNVTRASTIYNCLVPSFDALGRGDGDLMVTAIGEDLFIVPSLEHVRFISPVIDTESAGFRAVAKVGLINAWRFSDAQDSYSWDMRDSATWNGSSCKRTHVLAMALVNNQRTSALDQFCDGVAHHTLTINHFRAEFITGTNGGGADSTYFYDVNDPEFVDLSREEIIHKIHARDGAKWHIAMLSDLCGVSFTSDYFYGAKRKLYTKILSGHPTVSEATYHTYLRGEMVICPTKMRRENRKDGKKRFYPKLCAECGHYHFGNLCRFFTTTMDDFLHKIDQRLRYNTDQVNAAKMLTASNFNAFLDGVRLFSANQSLFEINELFGLFQEFGHFRCKSIGKGGIRAPIMVSIDDLITFQFYPEPPNVLLIAEKEFKKYAKSTTNSVVCTAFLAPFPGLNGDQSSPPSPESQKSTPRKPSPSSLNQNLSPLSIVSTVSEDSFGSGVSNGFASDFMENSDSTGYSPSSPLIPFSRGTLDYLALNGPSTKKRKLSTSEIEEIYRLEEDESDSESDGTEMEELRVDSRKRMSARRSVRRAGRKLRKRIVLSGKNASELRKNLKFGDHDDSDEEPMRRGCNFDHE